MTYGSHYLATVYSVSRRRRCSTETVEHEFYSFPHRASFHVFTLGGVGGIASVPSLGTVQITIKSETSATSEEKGLVLPGANPRLLVAEG